MGGKPENRHRRAAPARSGPRLAGTPKHKTPVLSLIDRQTGEVYSRRERREWRNTRRRAIGRCDHRPTVHLVTDGGTPLPPHRPPVRLPRVRGPLSRTSTCGADVTTNRPRATSRSSSARSTARTTTSAGSTCRYLAEFDFRYSTRKMSDTARTRRLLGQVGGKRLTYRPLRGER